ncbi:MAG: TraR/DksA family transcriptional regulator [Candidatus Omnitrophica bacterium]|nr:TraR/DksA family transcriptional regulator [Candidatus Omnitrophota bacterium]
MNKKELQDLKKQLLELREQVSDEIKNIGNESMKKSLREASGDLSSYSVHMADAASGSFEREISLGRVSGDQEMLYRIDEAIRKIEESSYGDCESCGEKIAKDRLKAIPYATLCRDCKQKQEKRGR